MSTLGNKIRERRIELGMTQEELALKVGYKSKSAINKIELGVEDRQVKISKIPEFADALGVSFEYLMGFEDDDDVQKGYKGADIMLDKDMTELFESISKLNPSNKKVLRTMVYSLLTQQTDNESD